MAQELDSGANSGAIVEFLAVLTILVSNAGAGAVSAARTGSAAGAATARAALRAVRRSWGCIFGVLGFEVSVETFKWSSDRKFGMFDVDG